MAQFMCSTTTINSLREVGRDLTLDMCPDGTSTCNEPSSTFTRTGSTDDRPFWSRFFVDQLCCFDYARSQLFAEMEYQEFGGGGVGGMRVRSSIPDIPGLQSTPPSSVDDEDNQHEDNHQRQGSGTVEPDKAVCTARDEASPSPSENETEMVSPSTEQVGKPLTATPQAAVLFGSYHVYAPERTSPAPQHEPTVETRARQQHDEIISPRARAPSLPSSLHSSDNASIGSGSVESYSRRRRLLLGNRGSIDAPGGGGVDYDDETECSATLPLDDSSYWSASTRSQGGTVGAGARADEHEQPEASVGSGGGGEAEHARPPRRVRWSPSTRSNSGGADFGRRPKWQRVKSWAAAGGERGRKLSRDRARPPRTIATKSLPQDATYIGMTEGYKCGGDIKTMCEV